MRFLLPILLCLSCFAQPNPINRRAVAIAGLATATVPFTPNLYAWWIATNVASGAVSTWSDLIQGLNLSQGTGGNQPTKATNTVIIQDNVRFMTVTAFPTTYTNFSIGYILIPGKGNSTRGVYFGDNGGAANGDCFNATTNWGVFLGNGVSSLSLNTNKFYDLVHTQGRVNSTTIYAISWTNGVNSASNTFANATSIAYQRFGADQFADWSPVRVAEILIWTNSISQTVVDSFHKYALANYGTNLFGAAGIDP